MNTVGVIPARLASSRLPNKLLLNETGKPLLQYVWEIAEQCASLDEVVVATDSEEIREIVSGFGGRAELTGEHPSGTDRVAEVVDRCCPDADFVVNLQGDEPELNAQVVTSLCDAIQKSSCEMATVATPVRDVNVITDPNSVKVVLNDLNEAMYFSRASIPFPRDADPEAVLLSDSFANPWLLHVGLYAYRREFLLQLTQMPPSSLETLEKLEQLRALQSGAKIAVCVVEHAAVGIDTREDYDAFVERQRHVDGNV